MKPWIGIILLLTGAETQAAEVVARFDQQLSTPSIVLQGVNAGRVISFTVPRDPVLERAKVILRFRHSSVLTANSTLTVAVNGTPLATVALNGKNAVEGLLETAIPPSLLSEYNQLEIQARQHYGAPCEDPFEPSLWTAVLSASQLVFDFGRPRSAPQLNHFPRPFVDVLDYRPARVRFVVPAGAAAGSLAAAARVAGLLGRHLEYKPAQLEATAQLDLDFENAQVLIGTAQELAAMPVAREWLAPLGTGAGLGFLRLPENPRHKGRYLLVISGRDGEGLRKAVDALLDHPEMKVLAGQVAVIEKVENAPQLPGRGVLPDRPSFSLRDLGSGTITVRGMNSSAIRIPLRAAADEHFVPYEQKVKLEFAYGSQLDTNRSTVEVILNGTSLKSAALSRPSGLVSETLEVILPHEAMGLENMFEVQFHLYPRNWSACEKLDSDHLWATLFGHSRFEMPRDHYALLPDLALMRHSGFPFNREKTVWILPRDPRPEETTLLLNLAFFLGRWARRVPEELYFDNELPESVRHSAHLLVVGEYGRHALLRDAAGTLTFSRAERGAGIIEEAISPWNPDRMFLVASGADGAALELTRKALGRQIAGNLVLLHEDGRTSTFALAKQRRFGSISWNHRVKYWVMDNLLWMVLSSVGSLFVVFFFLRFLRRHYFAPPVETD